MLGGGWRCGELLVSSSTFAVIQRICKSVSPQKHPHWKNTNTQLQYSLYCYSWDWWWQVNAESTVNARSSHSKCSRSPPSLVSAQLQLLPWLELRVCTLGAWKKYSLNTWNDSTTEGANTWELGEYLKYLNNLKNFRKVVTLALEKLGKTQLRNSAIQEHSYIQVLNEIQQLAPLHLLAQFLQAS